MIRKPLLIGHRGAMGYAPENTPASFDLAWKLGVDAVECDLHLSKDGELVIMHDESLDRTTSGTGFIRDTPWSRIRSLDAGSWFHRRFRGQRAWRLKDFLRWIRDKKNPEGRPLQPVLEIKNDKIRYPGIADRVAEHLIDGDLSSRAWVISFDHGSVKRVKILQPKARTGLLFDRPLPDLASRAKAMKADGIFPRWSLVTPALVRKARKLGLFVATYTVNEGEQFNKVVGAGVDALTTNFPDRMRSLLQEQSRR